MDLEISKEDADYMYNLVEKIVEEVGPRMPCSLQEKEGTEIIKQELEQTCDEVVTESFTCHPKAFLGWIKMISILTYTSMLLYILMQWGAHILLISFSIVSFLLTFLSVLIMWEELFNYNEFIDTLFRKKTSQNVIGKFKINDKKKYHYFFKPY
jgi:hypothetical protein